MQPERQESVARKRLQPQQRRELIVDAATRLFAQRGFRAASTSQLAEAAGITQPMLYRHFAGKTDLYLTCLALAWHNLGLEWERAISEEPDPGQWLPVLSMVGLQLMGDPQRSQLWIRSLSDAQEDERIHAFVSENLREVHAYLTDVIERARQAGGVASHVRPRAEAWTFLATGLMFAVTQRLGDVMGDDFFELLTARYEAVAPR